MPPCIMIRKKIFEEAGYFDGSLEIPHSQHGEIEFAARIKAQGYKLLIDGTHTAVHLHDKQNSGTFGTRSQLMRMLKISRDRLIGYFSTYADSYFKVLKSAPACQKLELAGYFPFHCLSFFIMNFQPSWVLMYPILVGLGWSLLSSLRSEGFRPANIFIFHPLITLSGRVIRAYGYFFRRLERLLDYLLRMDHD
ncbi:hypothetical protein AKJ47_01330 [candidate division MSBL1 archaeon SCGC-AAA261G05]|uniref:Uncharacterized protein n=1 Tax=candidate division MSBL1 archaeon SCGC-AAA261G05 TaxID=1698276 RepID=A0A133VBU6_9EURY|nr:hypothetical protein AKJ47_01330 [candidate division MSBL1 archaeon SCGC-AAA261G05]